MSLAIVALNSARSYLNDDSSISWSDAILFSKLQEAHRELSLCLDSNGIGVVSATSAIISVPAIVGNSPVVMPNLPFNLAEPITLYERAPGETYDQFVEMQETSFVPIVVPDTTLVYWSWNGQQILLVGATARREILLHYERYLGTLTSATDDLGFTYAELYDGPRTASLALLSIGDKRWSYLKEQAEYNLNRIISFNVSGSQGLTRTRRGYRRSGVRRIL